jgi:undecaprenyl diphosphate synthase
MPGDTMQPLVEQIDKTRLPSHIAIIMDGNGRWAEEKGQERLYGHFHAVENVRTIVEACAELGIGYLTLYAFSTENWDRPQQEVNGLMALLVDSIHKEVPVLNKNNIRLLAIGNIDSLPEEAKQALNEAFEMTSHNTGLKLIMALSYGSRWELVNAAKNIGLDVKAGKINPEKIDQDVLRKYLTTSNFPDPELMIRTSGEYRISNFLLYQLAYAELYFTETRWPDFSKENLYEAVIAFQSRERRFGKTGKQIQNEAELAG